MRVALLLALAGYACASEAAAAFAPYIEKVITKCDADQDGELSQTEFQDFVTKADLTSAMSDPALPYTTSYSWYASITKTGSGGGATEDDMTDWVTSLKDSEETGTGAQAEAMTKLGEAIVTGLTGISTDLEATTAGIGEANEHVTGAVASIEISFNLALAPDDLFAGERKQIKNTLISSMGCHADALFMTILSGSSVVEAKAFYDTEASKDAGKASIQANLGSAADASATLGYQVTSDPVVEEGVPIPKFELEPAVPGAIGGLALVFGFVTCCLAKIFAKKTRMATDAKHTGCCSTGCCSPYALKGWSLGVVLGVLFLLGGAFTLFTAMAPVQEAVQCLIDNILALGDLGGDVGEAVSSLDDVLTILDTIEPYIQYLSIAVIVPACLAAATLAVVAMCGGRKAQSMCCMKLFALFSFILLITCFVFYIIFAFLGIATSLDFMQDAIKQVTSICETTAPTLKQTLQDAQASLAAAEGVPGVDPTELQEIQDKLANAKPASELFDNTCDCIGDLFASFLGLFQPGLVCVFGALYSIFTCQGICCASNCCCSPTTKKVGASSNAVDIKQSV